MREIYKLIFEQPDRINEWWKPDKYNWNDGIIELIRYCSKYIDTWWNEEKILDFKKLK